MTVAAAATPTPKPKPKSAPKAKPAPAAKPKPKPTPKPKPKPTPAAKPKPAPAKIVADVQAELDKALTGTTIEFESGKATLTPKGKAVLDRILPALRRAPTVDLLVKGYTDSVGDAASNLALSTERAETVVRYFVEHRVSGLRLSSKGYGEANPIASNDTEAGRLKNRRIELTVKRGG
jgi:OOP family OmpA-OmpF porin